MNKILVHLRAPVLSASGYGVHARQIIDYLLSDERFFVFLENIPWGGTPFVHETDFEDKERIKRYYSCMANYEHAQAKGQQYHLSMQVTIPNEFSRRAQVNVGVTAGIEVDRATLPWIQKCNEMDLIIVPSNFSADILGNTAYQIKQGDQERIERITKPIYVIPEWFERPSSIPESKFKFSTSRNILFVGLWGNKGGFGEDRKNVSDLIRMFLMECKDNKDVGLVLKTSIITNSAEDLHYTKDKIKQIRANFPDAKCKIHLIHDHLDEQQMWSLYNHPQIQGLISLTHGEGFGLPLLEAAAAGLPVIATDWSGHRDFLREKNGFLPVKASLKDLPDCQHWEGVMEKGSRWASPDEEDARRRIRKFVESSSIVETAAQANVAWLEENFSKDAVSKKWRDFFDSILQFKSSDSIPDDRFAAAMAHEKQLEEIVSKVRADFKIEKTEKNTVIYLIPRSFGDVVISTSIIQSLIVNRHAEDDFYVATTPQYKELLDGLVEKHGIKVLDWNDIFMNNEVCRRVWTYVYNPTVNVQYTFSNWTLGNGEYGVRLLEEFAKGCNLAPSEVVDYCLAPKQVSLPKRQYVSITPVSIKQSKDYKYWDDVVFNLKSMGLEVVQLGDKSERLLDGVVDYRGRTFNETIYVVSRSVLHIAPDTGTAHVAGAVGVPHIVLFGSTNPHQCAPILFRRETEQVIIDSSNACEPRCYRDVCCKMKDGKNCLSQIDPSTVALQAFEILSGIQEGKVKLPILRIDSAALRTKKEEWLDGKAGEEDLYRHLGLTADQYTKFVEDKFEEL